MSAAGVPGPGSRGERVRLSMTSFPEFYQQCWPWLVRCLIAQAGDSRWAEDIAQETMMAARDKWDQLLTYDRPDAWLLKVAIRSLRRMEARGRQQCLLPDGDGSVTADLVAAAANDTWIEDNLDLVAAIRALPRRQAEVAFLHGLMNYTLAETAQILGLCEATAKTHKKRAWRRLQELLDPKQADDGQRALKGLR